MLFAKLLLSPMPHARVTRLDASAALAMPGREGDPHRRRSCRRPADAVTDLGAGDPRQPSTARRRSRTNPSTRASRFSPSPRSTKSTAAEAIEKIEIEFEPLPFVVDPLESLRPGGPNARTKGNVWMHSARRPPAPHGRAASRRVHRRPEIRETEVDRRRTSPRPTRAACRWARCAPTKWSFGDVEAGFKDAALVLDETFVTPNTSHQPLETAHGDGVLAERQAVHCTRARRARRRPCSACARWVGIEPEERRPHQRVHGRRLRQQDPGRDLDGHSGAARRRRRTRR